jgi:uncharacterized protein
MAEHENAGIIRRGYEAFNKGDMETLTEMFHEDAVWHTPGNSPIAGDHKGREATFAFFGQLHERSGGTFQAELHDVVANDTHAVGLHRATATQGDKRLDDNQTVVFHMQGGRITEGWVHAYDLPQYDAFFS